MELSHRELRERFLEHSARLQELVEEDGLTQAGRPCLTECEEDLELLSELYDS